MDVPDTADALASLAPWLALPEWLASALADLLATVHNMMRSETDSPVHRDEFLDAWGLPALAQQYRRNIEAYRQASDQTSAAAFASYIRSLKNEEAHP